MMQVAKGVCHRTLKSESIERVGMAASDFRNPAVVNGTKESQKEGVYSPQIAHSMVSVQHVCCSSRCPIKHSSIARKRDQFCKASHVVAVAALSLNTMMVCRWRHPRR